MGGSHSVKYYVEIFVIVAALTVSLILVKSSLIVTALRFEVIAHHGEDLTGCIESLHHLWTVVNWIIICYRVTNRRNLCCLIVGTDFDGIGSCHTGWLRDIIPGPWNDSRVQGFHQVGDSYAPVVLELL